MNGGRHRGRRLYGKDHSSIEKSIEKMMSLLREEHFNLSVNLEGYI